MIAVGYIVATLTLSSTVTASVRTSLAAQYNMTDAVASGPDVSLEAVRGVPGVSAVAEDIAGYVRVDSAEQGVSYGDVLSVADSPQLRWQNLTRGEWPTSPGEVLVSADSGIPSAAGSS